MASKRIIVVGGGLAGLMTVVRAVECGLDVDLFSLVPPRRSHSVCAQGGINASKNTRGEGDSPAKHFDDTIYGGDFLAHQPPVKDLCYQAPAIVDLLDRMGVMFNRTAEGFLDFRRFGGTLYHRTAYAGATTGQQILYALDEQVRRWESAARVRVFPFWEMLSIVRDGQGACRGIVAQDLRTMQIAAFRSDAVVLGTGGVGMLFGKSTNSTICTGAAGARAHLAGVRWANGEFIQVHPTTIPGPDKLRLMSESARGEGGRVWTPRDPHDPRRPESIPQAGRWYFLEEKYPTYGNLVPRDIASREIFRVCLDGQGIGGGMMVYLDLTHLAADMLQHKLGGILDIYEKFVGEDPCRVPMRVFPGVHYTMGGLWVDYVRDDATGGVQADHPRNQMTNVPGLYAVGEADYQYHGANRLGANSLLSCLFAGMLVGSGCPNYLGALTTHAADLPDSLYQAELDRQHARQAEVAARTGPENPYRLWRELGEVMTRNVTVIRNNTELRRTEEAIVAIQDRLARAAVPDAGGWRNQSLSFTRGLEDMLVLARVVTYSALLRDECRGAHYKPEFDLPALTADDPTEYHRQALDWCRAHKARNDRWLKTTVAEHVGPRDRPTIAYEPIDAREIPPRPRTYGVKFPQIVEDAWQEVSAL